jgi:hypothetical protein
MSIELKTINEWADLDGIIIIDADGFDRSDPDLFEKKISYEEYSKGILFCTIVMPAKGVDVTIIKTEGQNDKSTD